MRCLLSFLAFVVCLFSADAVFAAVGHVQIVCEPGCMVFLDGTFKGATVEELGGFVLQGVESGSRRVKVVRVGFEPFEEAVSVPAGGLAKLSVTGWRKKGEAAVVEKVAAKTEVKVVKALAPAAKARKAGRLDELADRARSLFSKGAVGRTAKTRGAIRVETHPLRCSLEVQGLFVGRLEKTEELWWARGVPAGTYVVICRDGKRTVKEKIDVREGETYALSFDLMAGSCTNSMKELRARVEAFRKQEEAFSGERMRRIRTASTKCGPLGRGQYRWNYAWKIRDAGGSAHEIEMQIDWWARSRGSKGSFQVTVDGRVVAEEQAFGTPCILRYPALRRQADGTIEDGEESYLIQCFLRLRDYQRGFGARQDVVTFRCGGYWKEAESWNDEDLLGGKSYKMVKNQWTDFEHR